MKRRCLLLAAVLALSACAGFPPREMPARAALLQKAAAAGAEVGRAWDALRGWVETGRKPAGGDQP